MKTYNLGFGDCFLIRELFLKEFGGGGVLVQYFDQESFNYNLPKIEAALVDHTKKIIKSFTGQSYQYVGLSHGATGGVMAAIRALNPETVKHGEFYFPFYPRMVKQAAGRGSGVLHLIDSPNNPTGSLTVGSENPDMTIFDAAYHTPAFVPMGLMKTVPPHKVMVGSFGKMFGLNGLRLGFFATNDFMVFDKMVQAAEVETLNLSGTSMTTLLNGISKIDPVKFTLDAGRMIDDNREEVSKLERYFDGDVPSTGMFYFPVADVKGIELLTRSGIQYVNGVNCGGPERVRLSLGNTREITREAVREVIKNDRK